MYIFIDIELLNIKSRKLQALLFIYFNKFFDLKFKIGIKYMTI
jgi:hypothetical protein